MAYFFIRDFRRKYRFFSSEPSSQIPVKFSKSREIWELAKKKLMLLPQRILRQEQAFIKILKSAESPIPITHAGGISQRRIKVKFYFFLQRQRTKHILLLIGEALLLPISGLAMFLPGPNVFFGALALLTLTHWQALRGINRLSRKDHDFLGAPLLSEWEEAADSKNELLFPQILHKIEEQHQLKDLRKVLWK